MDNEWRHDLPPEREGVALVLRGGSSSEWPVMWNEFRSAWSHHDGATCSSRTASEYGWRLIYDPSAPEPADLRALLSEVVAWALEMEAGWNSEVASIAAVYADLKRAEAELATVKAERDALRREVGEVDLVVAGAEECSPEWGERARDIFEAADWPAGIDDPSDGVVARARARIARETQR